MMDEKSKDNWADELRSVIEAVEKGHAALTRLGDWLFANVVAPDVLPHELPEDAAQDLQALRSELSNISSVASGLFARLCSNPIHKFVRGFRLTREEYHLLVAQGFTYVSHKHVGLSAYEDYEVFDMFFYEDDEWTCYIDPTLGPRSGQTIQLRIGACPEEVAIAKLRPEQRLFFETAMPQVAARFSREVEGSR